MLKKLQLKSGVNRENTRYFNENGWFVSQWVRFRQGTPEKIGGFVRFSANTFEGVCRSLWNWVTLEGLNLLGVGTNKKFYLEQGGVYYDITPFRVTSATGTLTDPFSTTNADATVNVADTAHGLAVGDIVEFSGAVTVGGVSAAELNARHTVDTVVDADNYTIEVTTPASSTAGPAGGTVTYTYFSFTTTLSNPFSTTSGSPLVSVAQTAHNVQLGDYVIFSNATAVGGLTINGEYTVTLVTDANNYVITDTSNASSTAGPGGGTVYANYLLPIGNEFESPMSGWGAGFWNFGVWGVGGAGVNPMRLWSQSNFGEDLVFAYRNGPLCLWDATNTVNARGVLVQTLAGANNVPEEVGLVLISDVSRFVFAFGANDIFSVTYDPMLVRWSDQESVVDWTPSATTQAGSIRLSAGSEIVARLQTRQEILTWTDTALYSLQYVGAPIVWGTTLLGDNLSIAGPNSVVMGAGIAYWMGNGKFYSYNGSVQTLRCDLRQFVFDNFNFNQALQVVAGSNEAFNEVWWFYPTADSLVPNRYVVYNYLEDVWYYGDMIRYAWIDHVVRDKPIAATNDRLLYHEVGYDDLSTVTPTAIPAFIESTEFDIDDGDRFGFVYRILPDITFDASTVTNPAATFTLYPMANSGTGFGTSVGGTDTQNVVRSATFPVEKFTGQVFVRVRGRQMVLRVASTELGVAWQLGAPRIDIRQDGRRGAQ